MIKAIIFDLDDTLYPEKSFVQSGFLMVSNYLYKKYKISSKKVFNILKIDFKNGVRKKNFDVLLDKLKLEKIKKDRLVKKLVRIYNNHFPSIFLFPDSFIFLKKNKKNFKIGLLTNGKRSVQKKKIEALKIKKYFRAIFINSFFQENDLERSKSAFKYLLKKLKSSPKETIYVGDNPLRDFKAAKELGLVTVRIKRKKGEYKDIFFSQENKADYEISNLLELEKVIKKIK